MAALAAIAAIVGLAGLLLTVSYAQLATGNPMMDRFAIRGNALKEAELNGLDPKVLMGVIFSESGGAPKNFTGDGGTSFGPGQVHLGGNPPMLEQLGYSGDGSDLLDEATGIHWTAKILRAYLDQSGGDYRQAIAMYKGGNSYGGQQAQAEMMQTVDDITRFYGQVV